MLPGIPYPVSRITIMYLFIKRFIDIILATLALVILSPILIPCMVILLLTGEHEIFYFQKRIGYGNKPFYIWKFATMVKNSPNMGTGAFTLRNDPRVTKFRKFLRMSKINELPQIINVLKGDMSLVGPRPKIVEHQLGVLPCRPGITGAATLVFANEEGVLAMLPQEKARPRPWR